MKRIWLVVSLLAVSYSSVSLADQGYIDACIKSADLEVPQLKQDKELRERMIGICSCTVNHLEQAGLTKQEIELFSKTFSHIPKEEMKKAVAQMIAHHKEALAKAAQITADVSIGKLQCSK